MKITLGLILVGLAIASAVPTSFRLRNWRDNAQNAAANGKANGKAAAQAAKDAAQDAADEALSAKGLDNQLMALLKRIVAEEKREGDIYLDEEDEDSIYAGLQAYMKTNHLNVVKYTDLKRALQEQEMAKKTLNNKKQGKRGVDKPHFIVFLIDDLGFNDVSWNNPEVVMPNMDEIRASGVILDAAYAQPVCSPSRGAFMTGLYPFHNGMQHDVIQWTSPECAPTDLTFLPEKLKDVGYQTHMLGKWHLGFCKEDCTPNNRGFDTFFGFYQGYIDHYTHMTGEHHKEGYDWRDNGDARKDLDGQYAGTLLEDRAVDVIRNYDESQGPMFMYFAHSGVHTPIQAPQEFMDMYPSDMDERRRGYLAMVSQVDASIGKVKAELVAQGMWDNTWFIFQSDNGGEFGAGSSNGLLRGSKTSVYEAGTRTPAMLWAKEVVDGGRTNDGMFHITDWHKTILERAGASSDGIDGVSQIGMLVDNTDGDRTEMVYNIDSYFPWLFGSGAIRVGDFKLIAGYPGLFDGWESDGGVGLTHELKLLGGATAKRNTNSTMSKRSDYNFDFGAIMQYISESVHAVQLYNLKDDPYEKNNLASSNPEKLAELVTRLAELRGEEREPDLASQIPSSAGEVVNYDGIWTTGWC